MNPARLIDESAAQVCLNREWDLTVNVLWHHLAEVDPQITRIADPDALSLRAERANADGSGSIDDLLAGMDVAIAMLGQQVQELASFAKVETEEQTRILQNRPRIPKDDAARNMYAIDGDYGEDTFSGRKGKPQESDRISYYEGAVHPTSPSYVFQGKRQQGDYHALSAQRHRFIPPQSISEQVLSEPHPNQSSQVRQTPATASASTFQKPQDPLLFSSLEHKYRSRSKKM